MRFVLAVVFNLVLVWAGALCGYARAMARHHRHMAEGWRYLAVVTRRRDLEGSDPLIAFSEDEMMTSVRRMVIAEDEEPST
jgi:hypothetical protein